MNCSSMVDEIILWYCSHGAMPCFLRKVPWSFAFMRVGATRTNGESRGFYLINESERGQLKYKTTVGSLPLL
jgi:hypothetical protein